MRRQRNQSTLKETMEEHEPQHSQAASQFIGKRTLVNTAHNNWASIHAFARFAVRPLVDGQFTAEPHVRDHFLNKCIERDEVEVDKLRQILFRGCKPDLGPSALGP